MATALLCVIALGTGCTVDVNVILAGDETGLADDETSSADGHDDGHDDDDNGDGDGDGGDDNHDGETSDDGDESSLDMPGTDGSELACLVIDLDAPQPCDPKPISGAIAPTVAWTWTGPDGEDSVLVTPLVGNLDDDNLDGIIDLCDVPEVLVIAVDLPAKKNDPIPAGHLYALDGRTGDLDFVSPIPLDPTATPALADLDADGVNEIIAFSLENGADDGLDAGPGDGAGAGRRIVALRADGSLAWISDTLVSSEGGGVSIADLDADGSPEILAPEHVLSADGELLWAPPEAPVASSVPIAADLDLDGHLEVLFGSSVYTESGELLFDLDLPNGKNKGMAAIANFDADPFPEIYVQSNKHRILEHDGSAKAQCNGGAGHPVAIEDLDGDGRAEILSAHSSWFRVLTIVDDSCVSVWSSKIGDPNAAASGTAFDLLGTGSVQPIFADLDSVRIFDPVDGLVIAEIPRVARSSNANPVVADVDNDGAAEIVLVGSEPLGGDRLLEPRPTVLLIQNHDDAFAPTRRIWNQHAYHGTNIREDGRVPAEPSMNWLETNSFRTNSPPNYYGELCQPPAAR